MLWNYGIRHNTAPAQDKLCSSKDLSKSDAGQIHCPFLRTLLTRARCRGTTGRAPPSAGSSRSPSTPPRGPSSASRSPRRRSPPRSWWSAGSRPSGRTPAAGTLAQGGPGRRWWPQGSGRARSLSASDSRRLSPQALCHLRSACMCSIVCRSKMTKQKVYPILSQDRECTQSETVRTLSVHSNFGQFSRKECSVIEKPNHIPEERSYPGRLDQGILWQLPSARYRWLGGTRTSLAYAEGSFPRLQTALHRIPWEKKKIRNWKDSRFKAKTKEGDTGWNTKLDKTHRIMRYYLPLTELER